MTCVHVPCYQPLLKDLSQYKLDEWVEKGQSEWVGNSWNEESDKNATK